MATASNLPAAIITVVHTADSFVFLLQRVMQLLHHTEVAVMTAQRAQSWREVSKVCFTTTLTSQHKSAQLVLLRSCVLCLTDLAGPAQPVCCVTKLYLLDTAMRLAWLMQKLHQGQPVDAAERDRVLRLPITLPSNYLRTAILQFQVGLYHACLQISLVCKYIFIIHNQLLLIIARCCHCSS